MYISESLYKAMVSFSSSLSLLFFLFPPFPLLFTSSLPAPLSLPLPSSFPSFLPSFICLFFCVCERDICYPLKHRYPSKWSQQRWVLSSARKKNTVCWQHSTSPITTSTLMEKHRDSGKQGKCFNYYLMIYSLRLSSVLWNCICFNI